MTGNGIEILLVEDNPADAELTIHALRYSNLINRIELARDGRDALDFLFCRGAHTQREPTQIPELVLLDLNLPEVDGIEVLRQLRNDPRTRSIAVVVLTCSREQQDIIQSSQLGINGYILKPVDFEQFRATVNRFAMSWLLIDTPPAESVSLEKQQRGML